MQGGGGYRGGKKRDKCNSIINKIYFKKEGGIYGRASLPKFKIEQQKFKVEMCCLTMAHVPDWTHRL